MVATTEDPDAAVRLIMGKEKYECVSKAKLLVVGAGGIGCELLKNMVLSGFKYIEVLDLDTIDISNLNRQFLFRRAHVDKSKSEVAAEVVGQWRPDVKIISHHGNVKEPQYGAEFISKFDCVVNALDNLEARRHVNRLCLAAGKPLMEAGSTGHLGQVTVIKKGETECFECQAKPTQKVYPYCTIRSTPEKPVHCLTWSKNLFDLCFGPEDESNLLSDLMADIRQLQSKEPVDGNEIGKAIFSHLFDTDIVKQAALEDLWSEKRPPPTPLVYDQAVQKETGGGKSAAEGGAVIDTQRVPTVAGDVRSFVKACAEMYSPARLELIGQTTFSKDDSVSMDFVHAAANLRMENYSIGRLSRWDAQSIAGSIIPAVASTNAIVAGLEVVQLIHVLTATMGKEKKEMRQSRSRTVWVRYPEPSRKKILQPSTLSKPNPECFVCGSCTVRVALKGLEEWKIGALAKAAVMGGLGAVRPAMYFNGSCIYDPEYPEASEEAAEDGMHPEWTLKEWGLGPGALLQVEDEGQGFSCVLLLRDDPELDEETSPAGFKIESGAEDAAAAKRKAEEAAAAPPPKKQATGPSKDAIGLDD